MPKPSKSIATTIEVEPEVIEHYKNLSQQLIDHYLNDDHTDENQQQKLERLFLLLTDLSKASGAKFINFYSEIQAMLVHGHAPKIKDIIRQAIRDTLKLHCGEPIKNEKVISTDWPPAQCYAWIMCKGDRRTFLKLYKSKLYELSPSQWNAFCYALENAWFRVLFLSYNNLHKLSKEHWTAFWNSIAGSNITALDLHVNELSKLSHKQWIAFCNGVANSNITSLDLGGNSLYKLSDEQWTAFWNGVAGSKINSLHLSGNSLYKLSDEQWIAFRNGVIKSNITSLNLSLNSLNKISNEQWTAFCNGLAGSNITALDLSFNRLHCLSDKQWTAFWRGIAGNNITSLALRFNHLYYMLPNKQWNTFKGGLKNSGIVKLYLTGNKFTAEQLAQFEPILEYNFLNPISKTIAVEIDSDTTSSYVSSSETLVSMETDSDSEKNIKRTPRFLRVQCLFFAAKKTSNSPDVLKALEQRGDSELVNEYCEIEQNVGVKH